MVERCCGDSTTPWFMGVTNMHARIVACLNACRHVPTEALEGRVFTQVGTDHWGPEYILEDPDHAE